MSVKIVFCTVSGENEAEKIAERIVTAKLAACVNIVPHIKSVYLWNDKLQKDSEYLLIIKTHSRVLQNLINTLNDVHSYDIPEILAVDVTDGLTNYINWVKNNVET